MQTSISTIAADRPTAIPLEYFLILWFLILTWILGVGAFSVISRRQKGKPIFRPRFPNMLFSEQWRSGRSFRSFWTRMGGAKNSLWVAVTDGELWVCPHFPFNLWFMPEKLGLEYRIPGVDILSVERQSSSFGGSKVLIRFRRADGKEEAFEIAIRDVDAFDRAIEQIRKPHGSV
jgi:hypothetical protein